MKCLPVYNVCYITSEEWNGLSDKLAHANREKCEAQAQVAEFQSQIVTSQVSVQGQVTTDQQKLLDKQSSYKIHSLFKTFQCYVVVYTEKIDRGEGSFTEAD